MAIILRRQFPRLPVSTVRLAAFLFFWQVGLAATLQIGPSGAHLHTLHDERSPRIEFLQPDEVVVELAEAIARGAWHLVRTESGRTGWVRAIDVKKVRQPDPTSQADEAALRFGSGSTWSARTRTGRILGGTWTGFVDAATGAASGTWTLRDRSGRIQMRGAWSANKSPRGWTGAWRATAIGQRGERSGTWSSRMQVSPAGSLADLFQLAVRESVGGSWQSGGQAGDWSIRAVQ
jgi:hypothetical protein